MKRICCAFFLLLVATAIAARADQTTSVVQQALKDQGFYYGTVTGQKNGETAAAIRRYQIRNGLQITGEIDAETLRSLGIGQEKISAPASATPRSRQPVADATRAQSETDENDAGQSADVAPENHAPPGRAPQGYNAPGPGGLRPEVSAVFAETPYELAPPDVQRHVIVGAQALLARAGFYRSGIDGKFGAGTAEAVRAFQARSGLPADGRLNMETLSALGLLPGQHAPGILRRRRFPRQPIYRGEWIPG